MSGPSKHAACKHSWSWLLWSHDIPFTKNRPLHIMIIVFILIWGFLAFYPVDRKDWLIENILLVLFIGGLAWLYRTFAFSNISYMLITLFLTLHTIGAHYTYQLTPMDVWVKNTFHTERGVYDRLVHLAFGLLIALPIREIAQRVMKLCSVWSNVVTFAVLLAAGTLFEIVEMVVALLSSPEFAAQYLGLQGDPMDSQKDMTMHLIGAMLSIGLIAVFDYRRHRRGLKE